MIAAKQTKKFLCAEQKARLQQQMAKLCICNLNAMLDRGMSQCEFQRPILLVQKR